MIFEWQEFFFSFAVLGRFPLACCLVDANNCCRRDESQCWQCCAAQTDWSATDERAESSRCLPSRQALYDDLRMVLTQVELSGLTYDGAPVGLRSFQFPRSLSFWARVWSADETVLYHTVICKKQDPGRDSLRGHILCLWCSPASPFVVKT